MIVMTAVERSQATTPSQLAQRVEELHSALRKVDPSIISARTGADFIPEDSETGEFHITYWGREIDLEYPRFYSYDRLSGDALGIMDRAMLAYYFTTSDGTPLSGSWISFSELPDGAFYTQAFQGYTGGELAKTFGNDAEGFARAALSVEGCKLGDKDLPGDVAFAFQVLPHVALLVSYWMGDEDFPASFRVLFDAFAGHHLTTDAYAILGSMLVKRIIAGDGDRGSGTGDRGSGTGDRGSGTGDRGSLTSHG
jgi:hypothetical protein